MFGKTVLNIAHRGLETQAPENTLAAFQMAINEGADGFELDVQLTKDGHVVVIHDLTVDRTTNGKGGVKDKTLDDLRRLDAGSWFNSVFAGERIPTLQEVLRRFPGPVVIDIELKNAGLFPRLPRKVVGLLNYYNADNKAYIASYNPLALWYVKRYNPRIKTKMIGLYEKPDPNKSSVNRTLLFLQRFVRGLILRVVKPDIIDIHHENLTPRLAAKFKRERYAIVASILEKVHDMKRAIRLGADIIITRNPRLLKRVLDGKP